MATDFEFDRPCARTLMAGASSRAVYGRVLFEERQQIKCLTQLTQDVENWRKYATKAEHSFLTTRAPSEFSIHWINQLIKVSSKEFASALLNDFLSTESAQYIQIGVTTYESVFSLTIKVKAAKNLTCSF
jgi:hypothetical protein